MLSSLQGLFFVKELSKEIANKEKKRPNMITCSGARVGLHSLRQCDEKFGAHIMTRQQFIKSILAIMYKYTPTGYS